MMMETNTPRPEPASQDAYRVEAPRVSDAVAGALCAIYGAQERLPADMMALLMRLERNGGPRFH